MIQETCTSNEWIAEISRINKADKGLVQKLIRALILLEGLCESNLKFVFKGGTSLMLLFNNTKRLSIDIDIVVTEQVDNIDELLLEIAMKKGFIRVEEQHRTVNSEIKKAHYKFFFQNSLKINDVEFILIDILFEEMHYNKIVRTQIKSTFVKQEGEIIETITPDFNNIMGDKLTAFASNTTGIPYYKKGKPMGQEIVKQLYDIGNLFEEIDDVVSIKSVFFNFALVELKYRNLENDVNVVFNDIVENCLSISLRKQVGKANLEVLLLGLKQITSYIFSETYHIEKATVHAARTAYLVALMQIGNIIERYNALEDMATWQILQPNDTKLNKLKKNNPEAFYYWFKYYSLSEKLY